MTRARLIPVLLLTADGIVKTRQFKSPRYLGDAINAVRIFNQKEVDELVLLDIEARAAGGPDFDRIEDIVSEAFMPVAYGGGIDSVEQCARLFRRGVEKVVLNTAAHDRPSLVTEAAARFGSQAVVVAVDARRGWREHAAYVDGGRRKTGLHPADAAARAEAEGAGEILVTSIDREGTFEGYDLDLLRSVSSRVQVPVVAHGGAGSADDFRSALREGASAAAAGSLFVFAARGEGVLISYPSPSELNIA